MSLPSAVPRLAQLALALLMLLASFQFNIPGLFMPALARVQQRLTFTDNMIGNEGMQALASAITTAGCFKELTHLLIYRNQIGDAGTYALANSIAALGHF